MPIAFRVIATLALERGPLRRRIVTPAVEEASGFGRSPCARLRRPLRPV
jgi:hypothetical protein